MSWKVRVVYTDGWEELVNSRGREKEWERQEDAAGVAERIKKTPGVREVKLVPQGVDERAHRTVETLYAAFELIVVAITVLLIAALFLSGCQAAERAGPTGGVMGPSPLLSPSGEFWLSGEGIIDEKQGMEAEERWNEVVQCFGLRYVRPRLFKVPLILMQDRVPCGEEAPLGALGCYHGPDDLPLGERLVVGGGEHPERIAWGWTKPIVWRHEMIHLMLFRMTGDGDGHHHSGWFGRCKGWAEDWRALGLREN